MANYVSKLSEKEKDQLWLENRKTSLEGKMTDLILGGMSRHYGLLGDARSVNDDDPNWSQLQKARSDANKRLQNPAGVPGPQLMQDHKLMEQVNREAAIKTGNYWSQIAENFALGKGPVNEWINNFPATPQAPTLPNVNMDFSGQPTPQAPQAPQNANVSFDFSGQPTLESLDQDEAMFAKAGYKLRPDGSYGKNTNSAAQAPQVQEQGIQAPSGSRLQQFGRGIKNFFNESGEHLDMLTETQLQQQNKALDPLGRVVESAVGATKDFVLDPNAPSLGSSFNRRIADKVSLPKPSIIYPDPAVVPQAPSIFQPLQTQPMPSETIGQYPMQANQFSQEAAAQVNPILAPQIDNLHSFATRSPVAQNLPSYTPYQEDAMRAQAEMGVDGLSPIPKFLSDQGIGANRAKRETAAMLQQGNGLTTVGGIPLSEFLSGKALPEQGLMRAENPMYGDNSLSRGLGGDAATQAFQDASAAREARIEQNFGTGKAVSDRERRGDAMSFDEARGYVPKEPGETASAYNDRVKAFAKSGGVDALTEPERLARERFEYEKLQAPKGLSPKEEAEIGKINAETVKILDEINKTKDTSSWTAGQIQAMKTQAQELSKWEVSQLPTLKTDLATLRNVAKSLTDGQIKTGGFGDQIPGLSNWARPLLNPDAEVAQQEVNGVVFKTLKEVFPGAISDGEREALVSTVYNPKLSPDKNAELINGYADRLNSAMNAKKQQVDYFRKNGSLEGYNGATPRDALLEGINMGSGSSGSPIEGDVDIQSESDQYYKG